MEKATPFYIGNENASQNLLIAYQGSPYKNQAIDILKDHFSTSDIHIKGIDIEDLKEVNPENWTAVAVMHTWEIWKAPDEIVAFHDKYGDSQNVIYFTTSMDGNYHLEGVDAITSASLIENIDEDTWKLIVRLEDIID